MTEKKFTCVLGDDCHIINNNVDNLTYYLQDGNDVVLIINLINGLVEENEQLKKEYKIAIDELITDYKKLEKENDQLRNELTFLNKVISFFADTPMTKYSSKSELLEEMKLLEKMRLI